MDAVDPDLTDGAESVLRTTPGVAGVDDLRLRWTGHRLRAEASVRVDAELSLVAAHDIAHDAQQRLRKSMPRLDAVTVHVSPARCAGNPST